MPIEIKDVSYVYDDSLPSRREALSHIDLTLNEGEFTAIIGHTGSGKSTLIQHLNGLIRPTSGQLFYNGESYYQGSTEESGKAGPKGKRKKLRKAEKEKEVRSLMELRRRVGLVFQYPEHQLFEMTVREDIAFGPKNLGLSEEEIDRRVRAAMKATGLPGELAEKSPFELSGGQKRRAAIAGVLAMEPEYLILDEPTAGLDPKGRDEILSHIKAIQKERGMAVILVSHSMEDVAFYAERVIAMDHGRVILDGSPEEVFAEEAKLLEIGLSVPPMTKLQHLLIQKGFDLPGTILTVPAMKEALTKELTKEFTNELAKEITNEPGGAPC